MARMGPNLEFDNLNDSVLRGLPSSPTCLVNIVRYLKDTNLLLFLAVFFIYSNFFL